MKPLLLLLLFCAYSITHLEATNCTETTKQECNETEYHSYVDCIRKRMKRSIDCENSASKPCNNCEENCQQCDCDYCAVNSCKPICTTCCPNNPPCTTNRCCHKTCHAKCKSSTCRSECRKTCTEKVITTTNVTSSETARHNITTIINLHNFINNTNVIDVPVHINSTNINNITLSGSNDSEIIEKTNTSTGQIIKEDCCYVVSPRQCVPAEKYPYIRCFHLRRKVCSAFCKAPIVHEQQHEICDETPTETSCHQQKIYIPQPQPRCAYQSSWPYVSCGLQQQPQPFCGGCYLHYNSPFPQPPPPGCSPACYDDGFGMGPYYRQGPFYRPGFAHVPSCLQTGSCGPYGYGGYPNPYGGFPPSPYGSVYGYPAPQGFGGFPAFPNVGYPPNTYENNVHLETIPENNIVQRAKQDTTNTSNKQEEVEEPPPPSYLPMPFIPQYISLGYPYVPQNPIYNLPPEVDIQAFITHPQKESRYAQITITKQPSKRESVKEKDEDNAIPQDTNERDDTKDKEKYEEDIKVPTTTIVETTTEA